MCRGLANSEWRLIPPLNFDRVYVAGLAVDVVSEDDVLAFVRERVQLRVPAHIVTVNAEFVTRARADSAFARVLQDAPLATPDGAGVVWAMRRRGARQVARVGGSDLIYSISGLAASAGWSVFYLGAAPGVAEETARRLATQFPGLQVVGTYSGSPAERDAAFIVDLVRCSGADILFVAFGAPRQEIWIADHLLPLGVSIAVGVGGSFDYVAGVARRAPRWMRDHALDWLWRLVLQPRRLRRMLALPRFVWLALICRCSDQGRRNAERTKE